jgi:hypothetical protein
MRITLTTYGGLAAGLRRPPVSVDTDRLSSAGAAELRRLVLAARKESHVPSAGEERARDVMTYEIAVSDGSSRTVFKQSDVSAGPAFMQLLDRLRSFRQ